MGSLQHCFLQDSNNTLFSGKTVYGSMSTKEHPATKLLHTDYWWFDTTLHNLFLGYNTDYIFTTKSGLAYTYCV